MTTGRRTFAEGGDGRGAWTRRWKDLVASHASDLGGEGLSEAQISICRRASAIECELEAMEGRMSASHPIAIEVYGRLASRLCRLLELIGIKPRSPTRAMTGTYTVIAGALFAPGSECNAWADHALETRQLNRIVA